MTKEDIVDGALIQLVLRASAKDVIEGAMYEYAKPYKEIADLISRIFYYGNFKAETYNERMLQLKLTQVGLWPTTEDEILKRPEL